MRPLPRLPDGVRTVLVVLALAGGLAISAWQAQNPIRVAAGDDFIAHYAGGEMVADGESPYDRPAHARYAARHGGVGLPMFQGPPVAAMFRIVALLPLRAAATAFTVASYLSIGALGWYVTARARERPRPRPWAIWVVASLALLQASPVRHALTLGQTDVIGLALVVVLGAYVPALALLKPQTVGLTAAAIFGRAAGVAWPFSLAAIRWRNVVIAIATSVALIGLTQLLAGSARWDDWVDLVRDRGRGVHWLVPVLSAVGVVVIIRGVRRARRNRARIDVVCLSAAATGLLAMTGGWNPQWFVAAIIPLSAVVIPYLFGEITLGRGPAVVLLLVVAASAGDGFAYYNEVDPGYHPEVPVVALGGLLFALWLLGYLRLVPAMLVVVLNTVIVLLPLTDRERIPVAVAAAVGLLYVLLEVRPSGLLPANGRPIS